MLRRRVSAILSERSPAENIPRRLWPHQQLLEEPSIIELHTFSTREKMSALEYGWWGISLEPWRPTIGTYGLFAHADLPAPPPLEELATMSFLLPHHQQSSPETGYSSHEVESWREWFVQDAGSKGFPIPTAFDLFGY